MLSAVDEALKTTTQTQTPEAETANAIATGLRAGGEDPETAPLEIDPTSKLPILRSPQDCQTFVNETLSNQVITAIEVYLIEHNITLPEDKIIVNFTFGLNREAEKDNVNNAVPEGQVKLEIVINDSEDPNNITSGIFAMLSLKFENKKLFELPKPNEDEVFTSQNIRIQKEFTIKKTVRYE